MGLERKIFDRLQHWARSVWFWMASEPVSGSLRIPWAIVLALGGITLGGGGATVIASRSAPPAECQQCIEAKERIDLIETRTRALEVGASRTDEKLDGIQKTLDKLDTKLDTMSKTRH